METIHAVHSHFFFASLLFYASLQDGMSIGTMYYVSSIAHVRTITIIHLSPAVLEECLIPRTAITSSPHIINIVL